MPIYTYVCGSCQNRFELRQGWDAESVATCPNCQAEAKRTLVVPSVIFKGRGWYVTDPKDLRKALDELMAHPGPGLVNVLLNHSAGRKPQQFGWHTS